MSSAKVDKKNFTAYIIPWLSVVVCLLTGMTGMYAQTAIPEAQTDTSYFKPGEENWNLVESVLRSEPDHVLLMLKRGADPNARAEGGKTALMYAAERGDTMIVKLLVLNGADLELTHVENTTPLMAAVLNQQFDAAHMLLRRGADPDHKDDFGATSLIYASAMNNYMLADLLLFFGASDSMVDRDGNNAIMTSVCLNFMETTHVLLLNGTPPDARDKDQNTPLMIAAQNGNMEMISLLLEFHAEPELVNNQNYTPLAHAIRAGHIQAAQILVDSGGANVHHPIRKNQNLYDLAVQQNRKEIIKLLKSKGAGPSPRPDFAEFDVGWGNSFGNGEHMMQARIWWLDQKFGFFAETGVDVRPTLRTIQVEKNDTLIHQYRETRTAWTHGAGKFFTLLTDKTGIDYGFYTALYGMLSFPKYRGIADGPPAKYNLVPSAGVFLSGQMAGIKFGAERYSFGTLYERPWKMNICLFVRIRYKQSTYAYKEISY